jgi:hypothetical protein
MISPLGAMPASTGAVRRLGCDANRGRAHAPKPPSAPLVKISGADTSMARTAQTVNEALLANSSADGRFPATAVRGAR